MKIRRTIRSLLVIVLVAFACPAFATNAGPIAPVEETPEQRLIRLQQRIEEIRSLDKSTLSKSERKMLRREVREIRDEAKALSGGVYISVGALLIIIILLLILL